MMHPVLIALQPLTMEPAPTDTLRWAVSIAYVVLLALICLYGLHRYWLVHLFHRHLRQHPRPAQRFTDLPRVTVQLPMYNEGPVAQRIIDAAAALDYPRDRLQIQVVDDSTDGSAAVAAERVRWWQLRGVDISHCRREKRIGFKAGALAEATRSASGEFIAIFDADFVPPRSFLKRTVHYFTDDEVGMVQCRWGHLNRDESVLTRSQAIFLDGHFLVEHTARNRSGAFMHFNGTAGVWRRKAIDAGGGWQHDTLTEDLDLSYRSQLAGWKFIFLPWVTCPAELPPEMGAFKSQQHRWTKGSIQCARKLLPRILRSPASRLAKAEAFFHLTCPLVYLYITLLALLLYPALALNMQLVDKGSWWGVALGLSLFGMGTVSAATYYAVSQTRQHRSLWRTLAQTPILMAIGIGIALNNAVACLEALLGHRSEFVRTPKFGRVGRAVRSPLQLPAMLPVKSWLIVLELAMGFYMLYCALLSMERESTLVGVPFLLLFATGYFYVAMSGLLAALRTCLPRRARAMTAVGVR